MKKFILFIIGILPLISCAYEFQDIAVEIPSTPGGWNIQSCTHLIPGEGFYIILSDQERNNENPTIYFYDKNMSLIVEKSVPGYKTTGFSQILFNDDEDLEYVCREEVDENQCIFKVMQVQSGKCIAQTGVFTRDNPNENWYPGFFINRVGDNNFLCIYDSKCTIWYLIDKEKINAAQPTVVMEAPSNGHMYNLNGQQISEPHGFYIQDGEKHIAK